MAMACASLRQPVGEEKPDVRIQDMPQVSFAGVGPLGASPPRAGIALNHRWVAP